METPLPFSTHPRSLRCLNFQSLWCLYCRRLDTVAPVLIIKSRRLWRRVSVRSISQSVYYA